jgi:hypothetical protein
LHASGDPRDPVDPIDWVERILFSETRNYVQRVMENVQVYRVRFGGGTKLQIEADLHRGARQLTAGPRSRSAPPHRHRTGLDVAASDRIEASCQPRAICSP